MAGGGPSRVVNVSSGWMYGQRLNVDDLQMEHGTFDGVTAYAHQSAEVILTEARVRSPLHRADAARRASTRPLPVVGERHDERY